jgi:putative peptide zinc metalloprotease protein
VAESFFSPVWYRVANLHPRLRSHVRVLRRIYRDQVWFVLQDKTSGRHHRVNHAAYEFVGRLDGRHSVQQIWDTVVEKLGEHAPSQDEVIRLLIQLNESDLMQCEVTPDVAELFRRRDERARKRFTGNINPLAFRLPLFDPSRLLSRFDPLARAVFQPWMLLVWIAVVASGLALAITHWQPIQAHAAVHMFTPRYLLLLWICYPIIKAFHELGHALAVRAWGGEVPELGVSVLVLVPMPYVDASAASAFREKYRRVGVSAMGIMVELLVAAVATFVWWNVESGLTQDIAFVTMFIGGVSTVLFNGNPLLRFDGYYVLADLLDLPNLGQRSNAYLSYLAQRHLFGVTAAASPATGVAERLWLFCYGLASCAYRILVSMLIVFWVSAKSIVLGVAIAGWTLVAVVVKPALAGLRFLFSSQQLAARRMRAMSATALALCGLAAFVCLVPVPIATQADGVVWLPEQAKVRAATDGFVGQLLATDGARVKKGQALVVMSDPLLIAQQKSLVAKLAALDVRYQRELQDSPVRAQSVAQEIKSVRSQLEEVEDRIGHLLVVSSLDGVLVLPHGEDMLSGFVGKGAVLAHVLPADDISVRVVLAQDDVQLVRERVRGIAVRLNENGGPTLSANLVREIPAASNELPSAALGDRGGGRIPTDPSDPEGLRTLEPMFAFDLKIPAKAVERVGTRVQARFDHGAQPLVHRWERALHGLVLKHFQVES